MGVTEWVARCVMSGMNTKPSTKIFYDDDYVLESGIETRTKAKPIAKLIRSENIPGVELRSPRKATREELEEVHSPEYLDSLWNGVQDLLRSLLASTGGVLDAVDQALIDGFSASLSSGLHHAKRTHEEGFCFINGLVIAALRALNVHKLTDIGILDLDAHCGGGTFQLIGDDARVRLVACSSLFTMQEWIRSKVAASAVYLESHAKFCSREKNWSQTGAERTRFRQCTYLQVVMKDRT